MSAIDTVAVGEPLPSLKMAPWVLLVNVLCEMVMPVAKKDQIAPPCAPGSEVALLLMKVLPVMVSCEP